MLKYKIGIKEEVNVKNKKKEETMLKDLLVMLPKLKEHKMEGEILTKIRMLRSGRKARQYTLKLSRAFRGKELIAEKQLIKGEDKLKASERMETLKELKKNICDQIKKIRKDDLPPFETYTFSQGVSVQKLAEVYTEPGVFAKVQDKKIRQDMTKGKAPKSTDLYVGVEIEFAGREDANFVCDRLFEAGVGKYINIKRDSSIHNDDSFPQQHEINILAKQSEIDRVVTTVCKVLNEQCHVRIDKTCGLHVHLDMRAR